jgi:O-antigen/teichoic acid export membrane protein
MSLLAGASRAFIARTTGAVLSYGVGLAVARALGPEDSGIYFLAIAAATMASVIGRLGLDQLLVRRVAAALGAGDQSAAAGTARAAMLITLVLSSVVSVCLFALAPVLGDQVFGLEGLTATLRLAALAVVPLSLLIVFGELLRGLSRPGESQLVQVALAPAATLIFLGLFVVILGPRPTSAVMAYAAGMSTAAFLGFALWRRATPWLADTKSSDESRNLARESIPFLGVALLTLALPSISIMALALAGDEAGVGLFATAYRTATLTSFALIAINAAATPRFADLHARGDHQGLGRSARRVTLLTLACSLPPVILFWTLPDIVMGFFGPGFVVGGRCLAILATGQLVNVVTGSVSELLMMSGRERALRANLGGSVVLSLVLHAVLVPLYGLTGAAIASATTVATINLVSYGLVRHHLSINTLPLFKLRRTSRGSAADRPGGAGR